MKIIEGTLKSGKTTKILKEYNNSDSIIIMPDLTIYTYTKDKKMDCKFKNMKTFVQQYSDYSDKWYNNEFNIQRRSKKIGQEQFISNLLNSLFEKYKDEYSNIIVDLDISINLIKNKEIGNDQLIVVAVNNDIEHIKETTYN